MANFSSSPDVQRFQANGINSSSEGARREEVVAHESVKRDCFSNFHIWEFLEAVVRTGSLTSASILMNADLSTASKQITSLERKLGIALLDRDKRPATVTEFVYQALPTIRRIQNQLDELQSLAEQTKQKLSRKKIRMSLTTSGFVHNVVNFINEYSIDHPNIEVEVLPDLEHPSLIKKETDVAMLPYFPIEEELVVRRIGTCFNFMVASPAYVRKYGMPQKIEDLIDHRLLLKRKNFYPEAEVLCNGDDIFDLSTATHFHLNNLTGKIDVISSSKTSLKKLFYGDQPAYIAVLEGHGIAVDMPLSFVETDLKEGRLVPVLPNWHRNPWQRNIAFHKDNLEWKELQEFVSWFQEKERVDAKRRWQKVYSQFNVPFPEN